MMVSIQTQEANERTEGDGNFVSIVIINFDAPLMSIHSL